MTYSLTRQEASAILWISTRSVDRYIKWGKIRAKKVGRTVMLNEEDIDNIKTGDSNVIEIRQEVITPEQQSEEKQRQEEKIKTSIATTDDSDSIAKIDLIYDDLRDEISKKDKKIEIMSLQLWKMEEVVNNSISMLEYKKSQFLLEESKTSIRTDLEKEKLDKEKLKMKLEEKSKLNIILAILVVILFLIALMIWWLSI